MILYHFTPPENVPSILEHGLLHAKGFDTMLGLGRNAVWLTTKTTREISEWQKTVWRERRPDLYAENQEWLPDATARLMVRLPSHDRKLAKYIPWLHKHGPWDGGPDIEDELLRIGMQDCWIYFGDVSPDKIVAVDDDSLAVAC